MTFDIKEILKNKKVRNVSLIVVVLVLIGLCIWGGISIYINNKLQKERMEARQYSNEVRLPEGPRRPSEYRIGIDYNEAMKQKQPVLVLFYADWCRYCIRFMPVFEEVSKKYDGKFILSKVNVEDEKYQKLVKEVRLTGFPTVIIMDPKYNNSVLISNAFLGSIKDISIELDKFLRIRKLLDSKK